MALEGLSCENGSFQPPFIFSSQAGCRTVQTRVLHEPPQPESPASKSRTPRSCPATWRGVEKPNNVLGTTLRGQDTRH